MRWLKFNAVGIAGAVVQIWFLHLFVRAQVNYLAAAALAVEAALLHNFAWHQRYTWADRPSEDLRSVLVRLGRFHLSNGLVSITGNLIVMHYLTGGLAVPPIPANLVAILMCSLVNFLIGDRFVFLVREPSAARTPHS
jgi:putative flippase GtrA